MKLTKKFTVLLAVAATSYLMYHLYYRYAGRRQKEGRMLDTISEEGYETASDILYPNEDGSGKLHYGPVIPR